MEAENKKEIDALLSGVAENIEAELMSEEDFETAQSYIADMKEGLFVGQSVREDAAKLIEKMHKHISAVQLVTTMANSTIGLLQDLATQQQLRLRIIREIVENDGVAVDRRLEDIKNTLVLEFPGKGGDVAQDSSDSSGVDRTG